MPQDCLSSMQLECYPEMARLVLDMRLVVGRSLVAGSLCAVKLSRQADGELDSLLLVRSNMPDE